MLVGPVIDLVETNDVSKSLCYWGPVIDIVETNDVRACASPVIDLVETNDVSVR